MGTLSADFAIERDLIGAVSGIANFTIADDFDKAADLYSVAYRSVEVSKRLMIRDERLPSTIYSTTEYHLAIQILNALLLGD